MALTPVAIQEGHYLANMLFNNEQPRKVDYDTVGTTVFSEPAVGACGVTEKEAIEKYGPDGYDVYESTFKPMFGQLPKRDRKSYVKLIVENKGQRVVGIHIMDHAAPEIIQMCSVAIRAGATKDLFDHSIGIHPTSAEEIVQIRKKREKKE
jgi:glutathione reductase (NADPH)